MKKKNKRGFAKHPPAALKKEEKRVNKAFGNSTYCRAEAATVDTQEL